MFCMLETWPSGPNVSRYSGACQPEPALLQLNLPHNRIDAKQFQDHRHQDNQNSGMNNFNLLVSKMLMDV